LNYLIDTHSHSYTHRHSTHSLTLCVSLSHTHTHRHIYTVTHTHTHTHTYTQQTLTHSLSHTHTHIHTHTHGHTHSLSHKHTTHSFSLSDIQRADEAKETGGWGRIPDRLIVPGVISMLFHFFRKSVKCLKLIELLFPDKWVDPIAIHIRIGVQTYDSNFDY
jgi:hypothetical protein